LGVAQAPVYQIAATRDGRLVSLPVALFDEVKKDQLVAVLSTVEDNDNSRRIIDAQSEVILAEIDALNAEWEATREQMLGTAAGKATQKALEVRRLEVDVEDARLEVMKYDAELSRDKLKLNNIEMDIKIFTMQAQMDANDVNIFRLKRLRGEYNAVAEMITENEKLRATAQENLQTAEKRLGEYTELRLDPAMSAAQAQNEREIEVQKKKMAELRVQLESLKPVELKAPFDGIVSLVQHRAGEAIMATEPIITIAKKTPDSIVAYATEEQAGSVTENMKVQLIDRNRTPNILVASHVVYVGPTIEQIPPRLWRNPNVPQYGRPIMIDIPASLKGTLVPGAVIGVKGI
jgi:multidrug resistance efflux pump